MLPSPLLPASLMQHLQGQACSDLLCQGSMGQPRAEYSVSGSNIAITTIWLRRQNRWCAQVHWTELGWKECFKLLLVYFWFHQQEQDLQCLWSVQQTCLLKILMMPPMVLLLEELLMRKGHHHLNVRNRLIAGVVQQAIGHTAQKHTTCFAQGEEAGQVLLVSRYSWKPTGGSKALHSAFMIGVQGWKQLAKHSNWKGCRQLLHKGRDILMRAYQLALSKMNKWTGTSAAGKPAMSSMLGMAQAISYKTIASWNMMYWQFEQGFLTQILTYNVGSNHCHNSWRSFPMQKIRSNLLQWKI